jgi:hypothetical protein
MRGRTTPSAIIIASCLAAVVFLQLAPAPQPFRASVLVAVFPFPVLVFSVFWSCQSRFIPVVCALGVLFAVGAGVFYFLCHPSPGVLDIDSDMDWVLFLLFAVPLEVLLAGALLLAVYLERKKQV